MGEGVGLWVGFDDKRAMLALVRSPGYHVNQEYPSYLTLA